MLRIVSTLVTEHHPIDIIISIMSQLTPTAPPSPEYLRIEHFEEVSVTPLEMVSPYIRQRKLRTGGHVAPSN